MMGPRMDTGEGGGGSVGPDPRTTHGPDPEPDDSGTVDAGPGGDIDTGGNDSVDRSGPQNTSYPGDTSGVSTSGGSSGSSGSSGSDDSGPDTGSDDSDTGTIYEDDDSYPEGTPQNPYDPHDNPEMYNESDNDPNNIDLGQGGDTDPDQSEATSIDNDGDPGGGVTHVTDGPDSGTSSDAAQTTAVDRLLDQIGEGETLEGGTVDATDPSDVVDAVESDAERAQDMLRSHSDTLSAVAAALTVGSVAYTVVID